MQLPAGVTYFYDDTPRIASVSSVNHNRNKQNDQISVLPTRRLLPMMQGSNQNCLPQQWQYREMVMYNSQQQMHPNISNHAGFQQQIQIQQVQNSPLALQLQQSNHQRLMQQSHQLAPQLLQQLQLQQQIKQQLQSPTSQLQLQLQKQQQPPSANLLSPNLTLHQENLQKKQQQTNFRDLAKLLQQPPPSQNPLSHNLILHQENMQKKQQKNNVVDLAKLLQQPPPWPRVQQQQQYPVLPVPELERQLQLPVLEKQRSLKEISQEHFRQQQQQQQKPTQLITLLQELQQMQQLEMQKEQYKQDRIMNSARNQLDQKRKQPTENEACSTEHSLETKHAAHDQNETTQEAIADSVVKQEPVEDTSVARRRRRPEKIFIDLTEQPDNEITDPVERVHNNLSIVDTDVNHDESKVHESLSVNASGLQDSSPIAPESMSAGHDSPIVAHETSLMGHEVNNNILSVSSDTQIHVESKPDIEPIRTELKLPALGYSFEEVGNTNISSISDENCLKEDRRQSDYDISSMPNISCENSLRIEKSEKVEKICSLPSNTFEMSPQEKIQSIGIEERSLHSLNRELSSIRKPSSSSEQSVASDTEVRHKDNRLKNSSKLHNSHQLKDKEEKRKNKNEIEMKASSNQAQNTNARKYEKQLVPHINEQTKEPRRKDSKTKYSSSSRQSNEKSEPRKNSIDISKAKTKLITPQDQLNRGNLKLFKMKEKASKRKKRDKAAKIKQKKIEEQKQAPIPVSPSSESSKPRLSSQSKLGASEAQESKHQSMVTETSPSRPVAEKPPKSRLTSASKPRHTVRESNHLTEIFIPTSKPMLKRTGLKRLSSSILDDDDDFGEKNSSLVSSPKKKLARDTISEQPDAITSLHNDIDAVFKSHESRETPVSSSVNAAESSKKRKMAVASIEEDSHDDFSRNFFTSFFKDFFNKFNKTN